MIRCECGGSVEIQSQSYGEDSAFESYKCVDCGRTGTMRFSNGTETLSGCLVTERVY